MVIHKGLGQANIIEIQGRFGVEDAFHIRRVCVNDFNLKPIIFNLEHMSFVGSSGLIPLLKELDHMGRKSGNKVALVGVKNELKRLINGLGLKAFKTYPNIPDAISAWLGPRGAAG